ncbi:hypothetical protein OJAV_G00115100 [Oryzias javanicus]|uniref:Circadian associated repressor of transcription n=1 Tax=Oryzias javanicus TaxID=123683 RepID=A0A437CX00_ORYJA|nr:hypothetical protein OJAV_G00115100 [Oryzias javanicus]
MRREFSPPQCSVNALGHPSLPSSPQKKMNSLGASSKWPSYDSLRSNSSFLPSEGEQTEGEQTEGEQTEDEADVFSEPEGEGGKKGRLSRVDTPPRSASPGAAELGSPQTPGDLAFAQKCADLHRFIHPLFELLHGLKTGRFDKGLNGFQQSVAIDRLQKILGILQRPEMGEKYLQNLLQIEMLLKAWFPQRALKSTNLQASASTLTPHWHQNQLHMPVKKRKLSWPDPRDADRAPAKHAHGRCDPRRSRRRLHASSPVS